MVLYDIKNGVYAIDWNSTAKFCIDIKYKIVINLNFKYDRKIFIVFYS